MNKCSNCSNETKNPKFCSRACSASHNNTGVRRHGEQPKFCPCGNKTKDSSRSHCSKDCRVTYGREDFIKSIENLGYADSEHTAKRYLLLTKPWTCEVCNLSEWMGEKIPLVMDHVNGRADDNSILNIRLICCNCDAQTPTYKGKNKGNGRRSRRTNSR